MIQINPLGWGSSDPAKIYYNNVDTTATITINAIIRVNHNFAYNKLNFSINTQTPSGKVWCDTISVPVDIVSKTAILSNTTELLYRTAVRFEERGNYTFSLTPIMPSLPVKGVEALGINIE